MSDHVEPSIPVQAATVVRCRECGSRRIVVPPGWHVQKYPLRPGVVIKFALPDDLSSADVERIGALLSALAIDGEEQRLRIDCDGDAS